MAVVARIQNRRDTAANWTTKNPVLASGELGLESDTRKFKIGDGSTTWSSLAYGVTTGSINASSVVTTVSDKSANYTLLATDENTVIRSTGSAITITIPNVLNVGESVQFLQDGSGQITFAAGSGATLQAPGAKLKTTGQYSWAAVMCVASGQYRLTGDLAA
jgi:hypothetical protein